MNNSTRIIIGNSLKAFLLLLITQSVTAIADSLTIKSARWGYGGSWCDVIQQIGQYCNGKNECGDRALLDRFPRCGDPAPGNIKVLEITYSCNNNVTTTQSREYLNWELTCPTQSQPNALAEFRIDKGKSCDSDEGSQSVLLPQGYSYCWHRKWDVSTGGTSSSVARIVSNGLQDGIIVDWKVASAGFPCPPFGRGWINHLWIVAGIKPGAQCPPQP